MFVKICLLEVIELYGKEQSGYPKEVLLTEGEHIERMEDNIVIDIAVGKLTKLEEEKNRQGFGKKILFIENKNGPNEVAIKVWRRLGDITDGEAAYMPYARKRVLVKFDDLYELSKHLVHKVPGDIRKEADKLRQAKEKVDSANKDLGDWSLLSAQQKVEFRTSTMKKLLDIANKFPQEYAREELKIEARNLIRKAADLKDSRGQTNPPASRAQLMAANNKITARIGELTGPILKEFRAKKEELENIVRGLKSKAEGLYKLAQKTREEREKGAAIEMLEEFEEEFRYIKETKLKPYTKRVENIEQVLEGKFAGSLDWKKIMEGSRIIMGNLYYISERLDLILEETKQDRLTGR